MQADGSRLHANMSAAAACLSATAHLRLAGTAIDATVPAESGLASASGAGLIALPGCTVTLVANRLVGNRAVGVQSHGASLDLSAVVVRQTAAAQAIGGTEKADFADGVMAIGAPDIAIQDSVAAANERAGLVFNDAANVALRRTVATGSSYGLVVQGTTKVDSVGVLLFDNANANRAVDKGLALPPAPKVVMP